MFYLFPKKKSKLILYKCIVFFQPSFVLFCVVTLNNTPNYENHKLKTKIGINVEQLFELKKKLYKFIYLGSNLTLYLLHYIDSPLNQKKN